MRVALLLFLVSACGNITRKQDDAGVVVRDDAAVIDAGVVDTMTDAKPEVPRTANDITPGGGRVSGGAYTVDVQIGHPFGQAPVSGSPHTVEGGAAIKP